MRRLNVSLFSKLVLVSALGIGVVACSSQKEDAEARGDIETQSTPQDQIVEDQLEQNQADKMQNDMPNDSDMPNTSNDAPNASDDSNEASESKSINDAALSEIDNADVVDGTEKEENISTY